MLGRTSIVLLACILSGVSPLRAQGQPASSAASTPIATDRPSVTDSSIVVPAGSIQAENGFLDNSTQELRTLDGPETLVRFGLLSKTELRFYVPDYYYNENTGPTTGAAPGSGFGDLAIGVKQQLGPTPCGFDVSVVAYVSFPTGAQAISSHGYDPALQVPWSHSLSSKWTLAGMLSLYWPTQGGQRNLTGEPTLLLDRQLRAPWDVFVEYAGDFSENAGPRNLLHFGTTVKIRKRQQLDFHVGVGSNAGATFHFFGFGYSFRIQAIRH
jgi:Putative MetA-pathway of phenol degradation